MPCAAGQLTTPEQVAVSVNVTTEPFVLLLRFSTRKYVLSDVDRAASVFDGSVDMTATAYAGVAV